MRLDCLQPNAGLAVIAPVDRLSLADLDRDAPDRNPAEGPFADTMKGFMALDRYGRGDEVAALVAHLAGPEAGFITGASLTIDGGFAA